MANDATDMSGIDRIIEVDSSLGKSRFFQLDQAALVKWAGIKELELWQAVVLHSNADPDLMGRDSNSALHFLHQNVHEWGICRLAIPNVDQHPEVRLVDGNLAQALKAARAGELAVVGDGAPVDDDALALSLVRVDDFQDWATRSGLEIQGPWQTRSKAVDVPIRLLATYRTKRLDIMEDVIQRYWRTDEQGGTYVPGDVTTATKQSFIVEWINENYKWVGRQTADAIAVILRPDELPKGRHPES